MCYEKKFLSFRQFVIAALTLALCLLPLDLPIAKAASLTKSYKQFGENNPIVTQRYSADSGVMVYNDTVYVYCTNDEFEYSGGTIAENSYSKIKTLNCFSSKDLVNWTDHGSISVAGPSGAAKWASCSWAPAAAHKTINGKEKFFLYFANNASGIGVLTADSPTGPWKDPIGRPLITGATPNCSGVTWCFDPAVFVDDDGTGYLCFGGGIPNSQFAHPKTTRIVKLSNDMTSLAGTPVTIDAPYVFEDSGINKIGGKYYYSYCSNWNTSGSRYSTAAIEYMVSDSPTGPYTYAGELFKNPGVFFGTWGNNHHSLFEFKGNYYLAYHARALETAQIGKSLGYRSTQIDKLTIRNGVISPLTATMKGVSQTTYVNPYQTVQAETIANQAGIQVSGTGNTEITGISSGDWTCVKGVSFQKGASSIQARVHSNSEGKIRVYSGSPSGTISSVTGVHDLYFVFEGSFAFDSWSILPANGGTTPNTPTTPPVASGTLQDGWYYIKNVNAQKYLQTTNNAGGNGVNVEIGTGTGVKGQKWYVTNTWDGYITLKNGLGYYLDIQYGRKDDGTNVQTYTANGADAQKFKPIASSQAGAYGILTKCSSDSKALDVYNFGTTDGSNVCQWSYYQNRNQLWIFEPCAN